MSWFWFGLSCALIVFANLGGLLSVRALAMTTLMCEHVWLPVSAAYAGHYRCGPLGVVIVHRCSSCGGHCVERRPWLRIALTVAILN